MRPDVKLGVVLSSVLVFVVGGYYLLSSNREAPIQVALTPQNTDPTKTSAVTPADGQRKVAAPSPTGAAKPNTNLPRDPRLATRQPTGGAGAGSTPGRSPGAPTATPTRANPARPTSTPVSSSAMPAGPDSATALPATNLADSARSALVDSASHPVMTDSPTRPVDSPESKSGAVNPTSGGQVASSLTPSGVASPASQPIGSGMERAVPLTATANTAFPASAPANPGMAVVETHRVQPGDTLVSLAQRYYGDAGLAGFLKESNPQLINPDQLRGGDLVRLPARPLNAMPSRTDTPRSAAGGVSTKAPTTSAAPISGAKGAAPGGQRTYQVKAGDSFYKIAKEQLGDSSRWKEIFQLNKERVGGDPTNLKIGQTVVLPGK